MSSRLYFDYNATTPLAPSVREALWVVLRDDMKNPSSVHAEGRQAKKIMEESREKFAREMDCLPDEIVFTGGATEANNAVFESVWETRPADRNKIVTTLIEHDSVVKPLERLQKKGAVVETVTVNRQGEIDLAEFRSKIDSGTLLVSVMAANNETGVLFPIQKLSAIAHEQGAIFHTDAACAVGKTAVYFGEIDADFLTLAAHKFYGPKGVGALLVQKRAKFKPVFLGGLQETGYRAGTENLACIVGMAAALSFSTAGLDEENHRLCRLRKRLKERLWHIDPSVVFHENQSAQLPGTLNAAFSGLSGQTLLANLDLEGVAASHGSACQSGSLEISRILLAMGIPGEEVASSIRLSFGRMTTEEEVNGLLEIMKRVIGRMRN